VHSYWKAIQAADEAPDKSDVDARACLGNTSATSPTDISLVDPATCRQFAIASLAVHQQFLSYLDSTPAPPRYAADDKVFRKQIPKAVADVKAIISACDASNKQAIHDATAVYAGDMIPAVTHAMDDIDPTVVHS
jgi:hypothetical protein